MRNLILVALIIAPALCWGQAANDEAGFVSLFNGKDLDGWQQAGGQAKYSVSEGVIVGESVPDTPNSFLCTRQIYGDFILKFDFKCDDSLNSGVQFRSNVYGIDIDVPGNPNKKNKTIAAGRVHGYQFEIDPNKPDRLWSGGVYDEGRRGWLYPGLGGGDSEEMTQVGQKTLRPGEWNSVVIKCQGNHIQTWLNGQRRADFEDDMTPKGIIALQVHGIGKRAESIGKQVMWRNIRIREL